MEKSPTFFSRFPDKVVVEEVVDIVQLISWSQELVQFCGVMGRALSRVKKDVNGNIKKIENACKGTSIKTVDELLAYERLHGLSNDDPSGTIGLLWLTRTLDFIMEFLSTLVSNPSNTTQEIIKIAYAHSLCRHHPKVVQKLFMLLTAIAPSTEIILLRLAANVPNMENMVLSDMAQFVKAYRPYMTNLTQATVRHGIETREDTNAVEDNAAEDLVAADLTEETTQSDVAECLSQTSAMTS